MKELVFSLTVVGLLALNKDAVATSRTSTSPKLHLISTSQEQLKAEFSTETGLGIYILSEVSGDGEAVRLSIKSTTGDTIFELNRPSGHSDSHLSVNDNEFLLLNRTLDNGNTELTVYHIPTAYSHPVKAMIQRHQRVPRLLLRRLNQRTARLAGQRAVKGLLNRAEMQLIPEAAIELGSHINGYDNPAAMAYYSTALRFSAILQRNQLTSDSETETFSTEHKRRNRRWSWLNPINWFTEDEYCPNSDSTCPEGTCPVGDSCRGLCGRGCECWWWVCQDCCNNFGCHWHDSSPCLDNSGSFECIITAPVAIVCS